MKLQDYLPYYLGVDYWTNNSQGNLNAYTLPNVIDMCERNCEVQLHLRKLADVSADEWDEIEQATSITPIAQGYGSFKEAFLNGGPKDRYHWSITNEGLVQLRKRSVDVDGLIENNLAIDSKTLK